MRAGIAVGAAVLAGLAMGAPGAAQGPPGQPLGQAGKTPVLSVGERTGIEPRAAELLKQMSDYLVGLPAFTVRATNTIEVVVVTGQKLQFEAASDVFVRRPDRFRSNRVGAVADVEFYYDGRTFTLYGKRLNYYATAAAPPTLDEAMDAMRERLDIETPGADLLYTDVYGGLMADVTDALYVGLAAVGGVPTHHLAFRARDVDWQIWIEDGARPLPRKYLITSKWTTGAPQFGIELTDWNLSPRLDDALFTFTPPPGAQKIDFLPPPSRP